MPTRRFVTGIDVSHHQGPIDWRAVADAGIRAAVLKATEGVSFVDPAFRANRAAAERAGIQVGAYCFLRPDAEGAAQAAKLLEVAAGVGWLVADVEWVGSGAADRWRSISRQERVLKVARFLRHLQREAGVVAWVYTSRAFWDAAMGPVLAAEGVRFGDHPLWVAHYTRLPRPRLPRPWANWAGWQHTDRGRIDGIAGRVDLDRFRPEALP